MVVACYVARMHWYEVFQLALFVPMRFKFNFVQRLSLNHTYSRYETYQTQTCCESLCVRACKRVSVDDCYGLKQIRKQKWVWHGLRLMTNTCDVSK